MSDIATPHDRYFRSVMTDMQVARDFFQHYLPEKIKNLVDLDSLKLCKGSYIDENLKLGIADILYSVNIQQQSAYLYLLVEHQSNADPLMAFRIFKYICDIMDNHQNKTKEKILPLVVPMVFYHGNKLYPHSTDILDLFGDNKALAEEFQFKPFRLIDMNTIPDEEIRRHQWSGIMEFVMKHIHARQFLKSLEGIKLQLKILDELGANKYIITTINYCYEAAEIPDEKVFVELFKDSLTPKTQGEIMTLAERLERKGREEGMKAGMQAGLEKGRYEGKREGKLEGKLEGQQESKLEIAKKLIRKGFGISEIVEITGLNVEEIAELQMTETG